VKPLVEARGVSCSIGSTTVFDNLSFALGRGEKLVLLGANGTGKTTLINLLLGFLPYRGSILVNGVELRDCLPIFRKMSGVVFSCIDDQLLLPNVMEEIRFPLSKTDYSDSDQSVRVTEMLEQLNLLHVSQRPPFELSAGEKQKTVLAAALISKPELLIMDEPTKEIDCRSKSGLVEYLKALTCSMIISTHDYEFARATCSAALVLHRHGGQHFESMTFFEDRTFLREMGLQ
jgi:cobalt/nickel transport system ATP-binding protein